MPSLSQYKNKYGHVISSGMAKKIESDKIMEHTWWDDINSRFGYFYDYYHDSEPLKLKNLKPFCDDQKTKIPIKFIQNSSQTYSKDVVTFHIQLMPSQKCTVEYYKEMFTKRYGSQFPVGLYVDIPDEKGKFNRWLVVDKANFNVTQFPTFEVLPCEKLIQYIYNDTKYQVPGVLRSQNSYNSGIWTDYAITSVEDQQKFLVPLNRDTEKIYYNQRFILDAPVLTEPRTWQVTKVNRIAPLGVALITLAQTLFDSHTDYIEVNEEGNVIGMWADYWKTKIEPKEYERPISTVYSSISYSGVSPQIKVGGSYKKFTVTFYDGDNVIDPIDGEWTFTIDGQDVSSIFNVLQVSDGQMESNQIKIKAPKDQNYIGKVLTISYITSETTSSLDVEIVAL